MSRTSFIQHAGRQVVLFDFSGLSDPAESLRHVEEAKAFVRRLPADRSALVVTDVRGSRYNGQVLQALKEFAAHNTPYVARSAVATDSGLHRIAILAVATFSGRALRGLPTREAALAWVVSGAEQTGQSAA